MFIATRHKLATLQSQPTVAIDGNIIERVKKYKCLGLELDECLMWDEHIAQITSKITKIIGVLRRLKSYLPRRILILIYKSLIQPHFDYCSSVWGNLGKGLAQKLQQLQNRAARIINGSHYSVRSHEVLSELNWSNLEERRSQQFKTLMFKTMNKMVPDYLSDKFMSVNLVQTIIYEALVLNNSSLDLRLRLSKKALLIGELFCGIACLWKRLMLNQLLNISLV